MKPPPMPPRVRGEIEAVCAEHGCTYTQLVTRYSERSRSPIRQAERRWLAMARLRALTKADGSPMLSLARIGAYLGGLDHSSVVHGLRRLKELSAQEAAE